MQRLRRVGRRGEKGEDGDGRAHRRRKVTVARGDARGFPEGLDALYQQSPAIYHMWKFVCVCVCESGRFCLSYRSKHDWHLSNGGFAHSSIHHVFPSFALRFMSFPPSLLVASDRQLWTNPAYQVLPQTHTYTRYAALDCSVKTWIPDIAIAA